MHLLSSEFSTSQKILLTMRDVQYGGQLQCETQKGKSWQSVNPSSQKKRERLGVQNSGVTVLQ